MSRPGAARDPTVLVYTGRRLRRGPRRLTPRLQPRPTRHRVVGLGGGLIWFVGAWLVSGFFSTASAAGGWPPTAALFLPGLLLLAVTAGIGRWPTATAGAVAVALLVGTWAYWTAPPEFDRLRAVAAAAFAARLEADGWDRDDDRAARQPRPAIDLPDLAPPPVDGPCEHLAVRGPVPAL